MTPEEALARRFHEAYERLAKAHGYTTREETREFDPTSPNGQLMMAVCKELFGGMDYRELLKKYLSHVAEEEGTTFLTSEPVRRVSDNYRLCSLPDFSEAEWAELQKLDLEVQVDEAKLRLAYAEKYPGDVLAQQYRANYLKRQR